MSLCAQDQVTQWPTGKQIHKRINASITLKAIRHNSTRNCFREKSLKSMYVYSVNVIID